MGIMTSTMSTIRVVRDNKPFPKCKCGSEFIIEDHFRKRKPKELVGTVARCETRGCINSEEGYLGYDYNDLLKRVIGQ
jgi:hypothetical protein